MKCNFDIELGISLIEGQHSLDLHNCYDFEELAYSIHLRRVTLRWRRARRPEFREQNPITLSIEFRDVSRFDFSPRDPDIPFSEDDCLATFGHWLDDYGVVMFGGRISDHDEPIALDFMSGAVIVIQAASAHATMEQ